MKKIDAHIVAHCGFCRLEKAKTRAVWRSTGCATNMKACTTHKPQLEQYEATHKDGGHLSEADGLTWGRL